MMRISNGWAFAVWLAVATCVCAEEQQTSANERIQKLLSDARTLREQGSQEDSLRLAQEAAALHRMVDGADSIRLSPTLTQLAESQSAAHKRRDAVETRREILRLSTREYVPNDHRVRTAQHYLRVAERIEGLSDEDYALVQASYGKVKQGVALIAKLKTLEGTGLLNESYETLSAKCGPACLQCRFIREVQHTLFFKMGRSDVCLEVARHDLDVIGKEFGTGHPEYANVLSKICFAEVKLSQFEAAERDARAAIAIYQATDDGDSDIRESLLKTLSAVYFKLDRLPDAERAAQEHRDLVEIRCKADSLDQAEALELQASLALHQKKLGRAIELLRPAVSIREKIDADPKKLASIQNQLGAAFLENRQLSDAEPLLKASLETYRKMCGVSDPQTILASRKLAALHVEREEWEPAIELLRPVYRLLRSKLGTERPETTETRDMLVRALRGAKRDDEADELLREPRPFVVKPAANP